MLLAVDVGNTNVSLGVYDGDRLAHHFRVQSDTGRTVDEYALLVTGLLQRVDVSPAAITGAALCSVVPSLTQVLESTVAACFRVPCMTVGPGIKTGMPILTDNPREVGADRIVNAVAAWERFHAPLIVVDFGTATTFDAVSARGEYLGGAIAPGVGVGMDALFRAAAKLPRVEFARPGRVVGRNTVHGIQSGLFYGCVAMVDGMVERMTREMDAGRVRVIATGGWSALVKGESRTLEVVEEFLTLDGLRILHERNRRPA